MPSAPGSSGLGAASADAAPPIGDSAEGKKRGWPKGRKRKSRVMQLKQQQDNNSNSSAPNAAKANNNAMKAAYMRFVTTRRAELLKGGGGLSYAEATKLLGDQWLSMSDEEKRAFVAGEAAPRDAPTSSKHRAINKPTKRVRADGDDDDAPSVPIFTEAFLDYNKAKESELQQLTKANASYEQQNALLDRHVENLKRAVVELETKQHAQEARNSALQQKLRSVRLALCAAFDGVALPPDAGAATPTAETVEAYLSGVCAALEKGENDDFAALVHGRVTAAPGFRQALADAAANVDQAAAQT